MNLNPSHPIYIQNDQFKDAAGNIQNPSLSLDRRGINSQLEQRPRPISLVHDNPDLPQQNGFDNAWLEIRGANFMIDNNQEQEAGVAASYRSP